MGKSHLSWWFGCKEDGLHRGKRASGEEGKKGEKKTGCEGRWEGRLQAWGVHTIPQRLLFMFYYLTLYGCLLERLSYPWSPNQGILLGGMGSRSHLIWWGWVTVTRGGTRLGDHAEPPKQWFKFIELDWELDRICSLTSHLQAETFPLFLHLSCPHLL